MRAINEGRWTNTRSDQGFVVFLIGARVNKPAAVRSWLPVVTAMPKMLMELQREPDLGLLGVTNCVHGRGALAVQYWRDLESLLAYAQGSDHEHRPAWREFNRRVRDARGAVGIWHETFVVAPRASETIYVDMPAQGLPRALGAEPVDVHRNSSRERLGSAA